MMRSILLSFVLCFFSSFRLDGQCTATLNGDGAFCQGGTADLTIDLTGEAPWSVGFTINGVPQPNLDIASTPYLLSTSQVGVYSLVSVSGTNCAAGTVSGVVTVATSTPIQIDCVSSVINCNTAFVPLICSVSGGIPPYQYIWSNGSIAQIPVVNAPGVYTVTIVDAMGCTGVSPVVVIQDISFPTCSVELEELSCSNPEVVISPVCVGGVPPFTYLWSTGITTPSAIINFPGNYTLTVTDANGCLSIATYTITANDEGCGHLTGYVRDDTDLDCQADPSEAPLPAWVVRASDGTTNYFDLTSANGFYDIAVPPGNYTVEVLNNFPDLWASCSPPANLVIVDTLDADSSDFSLQKLVDCPAMEVDISAPFLRRCFPNTFHVNYCNLGTVTATGAMVEVTFDPDFSVTSAGVPFSNPAPGLFVFAIGDVGIGQCGQFSILTQLSCNALLGEALCTEAHIFPDTLCTALNPLWSGASLQITSECAGSEVIFTITNTGTGDMTDPIPFIVIEDGVMLTTDPQQVLLLAGASTEVSFPANGSTYVLQLDQVDNHPGLSAPLLALEGCGVNSMGGFSTGFVTQFPENDADPFLSIDCQVVIGAFDPNDKYGYPEGFGDENFIELGQDLEYRIRFQNTGTDTAFNVVIHDVLSLHLDLASLRLGSASHPYHFSVIGGDTLVFTFKDIMLPDSNTNEPASHGFVKFRVQQSAGNVLGDLIENEAAIYFDFNEPVITNRTRHRLGEHFILSALPPDRLHTLVQHTIQPNPTSGEATLILSGQVPFGEMTFSVYHASGQLAFSQKHQAPMAKLPLGSLKSGLYFYEITMESGVIGRGRLVVR